MLHSPGPVGLCGSQGELLVVLIVLFFTRSLLPSVLSYTAIKAFSKMINEVNDLAGQRELISEYLESEVCVEGVGCACVCGVCVCGQGYGFGDLL